MPEGHQTSIDEAVMAQQNHPRIGPHQKVGPEGQHDEEQQNRLPASGTAGNDIGQRKAHDEAENRGHSRIPHGLSEDLPVQRMKEIEVIGRRDFPDNPAIGSTRGEADCEHQPERYEKEEAHPDETGGSEPIGNAGGLDGACRVPASSLEEQPSVGRGPTEENRFPRGEGCRDCAANVILTSHRRSWLMSNQIFRVASGEEHFFDPARKTCVRWRRPSMRHPQLLRTKRQRRRPTGLFLGTVAHQQWRLLILGRLKEACPLLCCLGSARQFVRTRPKIATRRGCRVAHRPRVADRSATCVPDA